jgi:S-phase kinase-associated protein 1
MAIIRLQSSDGEIFPVDIAVAKKSNTIKTMLDDLGVEDGDEEIVPLPNVDANILKKVIEWSSFHKDDPEPTDDDEYSERIRNEIPSWDTDFLKVDQSTLFEIILAANYLDIKGLLEVGCKTVANMMKGKSPEEIRKIFNIKNDLTPEEEEAIRKENEWCEEK